jgi:hypothetical protein
MINKSGRRDVGQASSEGWQPADMLTMNVSPVGSVMGEVMSNLQLPLKWIKAALFLTVIMWLSTSVSGQGVLAVVALDVSADGLWYATGHSDLSIRIGNPDPMNVVVTIPAPDYPCLGRTQPEFTARVQLVVYQS